MLYTVSRYMSLCKQKFAFTSCSYEQVGTCRQIPCRRPVSALHKHTKSLTTTPVLLVCPHRWLPDTSEQWRLGCCLLTRHGAVVPLIPGSLSVLRRRRPLANRPPGSWSMESVCFPLCVLPLPRTRASSLGLACKWDLKISKRSLCRSQIRSRPWLA